MRSGSPDQLTALLGRGKRSLPDKVHWELTYRCNLACGHCYCRGMGDRRAELPIREARALLERLRQAGCLWLSLSGGEPLAREDFPDIYGYAKEQGFLITILTNGLLWDERVIRSMRRRPPHSIEVTVNGATARTYEAVTGAAGSFELLRKRARALFRSGLPVVVKANLLKPNQGEVGAIKRWAEENLGRPPAGHRFKYDPHVHPRLNGDRAPLEWRLSYDEMAAAVRSDPEMGRQFEQELCRDFPEPEAPADRLYHCSLWRDWVFVSPAGFGRPCLFSAKFGFDLKTTTLEEGVPRALEAVHDPGFRSQSKCRSCGLRPVCLWCPARARLETGSEERSVSAYCRYAERLAVETVERKDAKNILSRVQA